MKLSGERIGVVLALTILGLGCREVSTSGPAGVWDPGSGASGFGGGIAGGPTSGFGGGIAGGPTSGFGGGIPTTPTYTAGASGSNVPVAGMSAGAPGAGISGAAGSGPYVVDAGTNAGGGAGGTAGTTPDAGTVHTSKDPQIPPVAGACPNFVTGSFSFQGLTGLMEVGPKGNGGGSLVFHWHGTGMPASTYTMMGAGVQKITSQGGIIVSPDGPATGEPGDVFCSGTAIFGATTTFTIVDQIVACAVRDYAIDPHRIYATGCSAGGLQSGCMAAQRSSYVAAVAPNSGGLVAPMAYQNPDHIPPVMTMHGAPGVDVVVLDFSVASGTLDDQTTNAGGFAMDCNHGGGHCMAPADLQSAAVDFLLAHPFGVDPEPYTPSIPPGFPSYCVIF